MKIRCIYLIFIMGLVNVLSSQPPNFQKIQFTIEDGLPSNECHDIVEDSNGYIWIATNRGLVKYDGYGFHTYGFSDGLEDIVCLKLCKDKFDNIWILTLSKTIYIYDQLKGEIVKYQFDSKLEPYRKFSPLADAFYVAKDLSVHINFVNVFPVIIDINGSVKEYQTNNEYVGYQVINIDDKIIIGDDVRNNDLGLKIYEPKMLMYRYGLMNEFYFTLNNQKIKIPFNKNWNRKSLKTAFKLNNENIIMSSHGVHYILEKDQINFYKNGTIINDLLLTNTNAIITAQMDNNGVKYFNDIENFKQNNYSYILKNHSASNLLLDSQNNLWVTTLEDGVFFFLRSNITLFNDSISRETKVSEIEVSEDGELYFIENDINLRSKGFQSDQGNVQYKFNSKIQNLNYDSYTKTLLICGIETGYYKEGDYHKMSINKTTNKDLNYVKNISRMDSSTLILNTVRGFFTVDDETYEVVYRSNPDIKRPAGPRIHSIARYYDDYYLIGAIQGLFELRNERYYKLDSIFPEFNAWVNDIDVFQSNYIIATQGEGLLIWDGKDQLDQIKVEHGLASNILDNVTVNKNGQIYISSFSGMSVVFKEDSTYSVKNYTTAEGLPSNEVYDIDYYKNTIYVATGKGLCKIEGIEPVKHSIKKPLIEGLIVNNDKYHFDENIILNHDQNNIRISFKTIDLPSRGNLEYRYKINNDSWTNTNELSLNYPRLISGNYMFEVQSKNTAGNWSDSTYLKFVIKPPFWKTTWFIIVAILSFIGACYLWLKGRIKKINKSIQLQNELYELERKALQAQMNPHFIFNCLHSIQNFIMLNDKESAMNYLSKFAKLIRKNLKASVDKVIPLDEEISSLRNYIELEQVRFNSNFDYTIDSKEIEFPSRIMIPPILIQPYVENAIIHGMKNKSGGGFISIKFSSKENRLFVEISDNGGGIRNNKNQSRRSFGTDITRKRLAHINKSKGEGYEVDTNSNENGTTVNLRIDLN